jgi:hypothetical protein
VRIQVGNSGLYIGLKMGEEERNEEGKFRREKGEVRSEI